jgi:Myb-like DNA-binding domain
MFGNKWNDIASYLPMRCNNDIKNHFNLYLKEKQTAVSTENTFLRASYDLPSLLAVEPEEVQSRRERLDRERVRGTADTLTTANYTYTHAALSVP